MALLLLPWIAFLVVTLPHHEIAAHWRLAWSGFDVGLAAALGATGILLVRRSPAAEIAAAITGTILVCDAWFDVLTSRGAAHIAFAAAEAVLVELPLAGLCFWVARNVERVLTNGKPRIVGGGFPAAGRRTASEEPE
jgi:hypothetical protein